MQNGGAYTSSNQQEGILLQRSRDTDGRCIVILFKSIAVRGRRDFLSFPTLRCCNSAILLPRSLGGPTQDTRPLSRKTLSRWYDRGGGWVAFVFRAFFQQASLKRFERHRSGPPNT